MITEEFRSHRVTEDVVMLRLISFFLRLISIALAIPTSTVERFQPAFNSDVVPGQGGRIVGGNSTTIDKFPYQISLQKNGRHICGGSIISSQWVLTAAQCVGDPSASYSVRVGTSTPNSGGAVYKVDKVVGHPNYDNSTHDYDIAVIQIPGSFQFGRNVQAVDLANYTSSHGTDAVVTGWGILSDGNYATILQYVHVPVVSNGLCDYNYGNQGPITDRMMCAGFSKGDKDACGDFGSPLVADGVQVGIASWGYGCAQSNYPGVYTSVANLRSWIKRQSGV